MNHTRMRVNSAGSSRAAFAPSGDGRMMRDTVLKLQQDVLCAKAETQKVNDQLNCLINLVKRAWTGDEGAAIHVANIVGVAPPDRDNRASTENPSGAPLKPKSRPLNNWAVLTIGLLNREYKVIERQLERKQRQYLQARQNYFEEQLLHHRDMQAKLEYEAMTKVLNSTTGQVIPARPKSSHHTVLVKSSSHGDLSNAVSNERTNSHFSGGIQRPAPMHGREAFLTQPPPSPQPEIKPPRGQMRKQSAGRPLFRPQSSKTRKEEHISVSDLFVDPSQAAKINKSTHQTMDGIYRLANVPSKEQDVPCQSIYHYDPDYMGYGDPRRYVDNSIFDVESAIGHEAVAKRRRPTSAVEQKKTDTLRARPKSAVTPGSNGHVTVYTPGERPLKYETTRPASGKTTSTNSATALNKGKGKAKKSKQGPLANKDENGENEGKENKDGQEEEDFDVPQPLYTPITFDMKINIDKPKSVTDFEKEVNRMNDMEKDFRQTTMELQQKLGISKDGMIY